MKKIIGTLFLLLAVNSAAFAQDDSAEKSSLDTHRNYNSETTIFGGYSKYLYSYNDNRYVDSYKGDYISSNYQYYGIEFVHYGIKEGFDKGKDVVWGGNLVFAYQSALTQKNLYAVTSPSIPAETIPKNASDAEKRQTYYISGFVGIDKSWLGADIGLTGQLNRVYLKNRQYYAENGTIINKAANTWVMDNDNAGTVHLNFKLRLGFKDSYNFIFEYYRDNYNPLYGTINSKIEIPVVSFMSLGFGTYVYPSNAVYIEPAFSFLGFKVKATGGMVLNYYDSKLRYTEVADSLFAAGSLTYSW